MYREHFHLTHELVPQDAAGKTFYAKLPDFDRLRLRFRLLAEDHGLGLLTADPGVGKTAALRHLTSELPKPEYLTVYLPCFNLGPGDIYRLLAQELGLAPAFRRASLIRQLKDCLCKLAQNEQRHTIIILDEAHALPQDFLLDLSALLNFAMDSKRLCALWLCGQPGLRSTLSLSFHQPIFTRLRCNFQLQPIDDSVTFKDFFAFCCKNAGAERTLFTDTAQDLIFRASRGVPRLIGKLAEEALLVAAERSKDLVDELILDQVLEQEA